MKTLSLVCLLVLINSYSHAQNFQNQFVICTGEWESYLQESNSKNNSFLAKIFENSLNVGRKSIRFQLSNWEHCLEAVKLSKTTATVGIGDKLVFQDDYFISVPFYVYFQLFFQSNDSIVFSILQKGDFKEFEIHTIHQGVLIEQLRESGFKVIVHTNESQMLESFRQGDIRLILDFELRGKKVFKDLFQSETNKFQHTKMGFAWIPVYLLFPKNNNGEKMCNEYNKSFQFLWRNGLIFQILRLEKVETIPYLTNFNDTKEDDQCLDLLTTQKNLLETIEQMPSSSAIEYYLKPPKEFYPFFF